MTSVSVNGTWVSSIEHEYPVVEPVTQKQLKGVITDTLTLHQDETYEQVISIGNIGDTLHRRGRWLIEDDVVKAYDMINIDICIIPDEVMEPAGFTLDLAIINMHKVSNLRYHYPSSGYVLRYPNRRAWSQVLYGGACGDPDGLGAVYYRQ